MTDHVNSQNFKGSVWPSLFHLTLSLTGEATAAVEVQALHAFGEDECTDITVEAIAAVEVQFLHAFGDDECTDITCEGRRRGRCERMEGEREYGCTRIQRSEFIHRHNQ